MISRIEMTNMSNCRGTKRNCVKISDSALICSRAFFVVRPYFSIVAIVFACCSFNAVNFSRAISGSIELSPSSESALFSRTSPSSSCSSSSSSSRTSAFTSLFSSSSKLSSNSAISSPITTAFGSTKPVIKSAKRTEPSSTSSYCSSK